MPPAAHGFCASQGGGGKLPHLLDTDSALELGIDKPDTAFCLFVIGFQHGTGVVITVHGLVTVGEGDGGQLLVPANGGVPKAGFPTGYVRDGLEEAVCIAQSEEGDGNVCGVAIVVDPDDLADHVGAPAGGLPSIGPGAVLLVVIQEVNGVSIGIADLGEIAVVEFLDVVLFVF